MVIVAAALPWGERLAEVDSARIRAPASIGASSLRVADRAELLDQ
jgi:hypothetical protein